MNKSALRIACAALIMAAGIWSGARVYSSRSGAAGHGAVAVPAGQASAPNPSDLTASDDTGFVPPKIPEHLPLFSLKDGAGRDTSIASFRDKSLVINFWATWCAPCRREIPMLQALQSEWAARDVNVVGIAVDHRDKVLEFAAELKIGYPLLIGEQDALDAAAMFGMEAPVFPFTVFTDRRGQVVALFVGELHKPQANFILRVVQSLNDDRVGLPEARRTIAAGLEALAEPHPG